MAALFVIDIQVDLAADPRTRIDDHARICDAATHILEHGRGLLARRQPGNLPQELSLIVFVQHEESPENGPLVKGSDPWKLVFEPRRGVADEWLVAKTTRDTFASNPDLVARLRAQGIESVVACGIQSECCVEETCKGALEAGFAVTLLQGAHSTYANGEKTAARIEQDVEERLAARGAKMVKWEEWIKATTE